VTRSRGFVNYDIWILLTLLGRRSLDKSGGTAAPSPFVILATRAPNSPAAVRHASYGARVHVRTEGWCYRIGTRWPLGGGGTPV
jgi:hypothetical protein